MNPHVSPFNAHMQKSSHAQADEHSPRASTKGCFGTLNLTSLSWGFTGAMRFKVQAGQALSLRRACL